MKKLVILSLAALVGACTNLSHPTVTGMYKGVLPCADCEKIQAELTLDVDNHYVYNTVYFKNKKQFAYTDRGVFSWDKNKENVIRLDNDSGNLAFHISENAAEICDADGNQVQSKLNYQLEKIR